MKYKKLVNIKYWLKELGADTCVFSNDDKKRKWLEHAVLYDFVNDTQNEDTENKYSDIKDTYEQFAVYMCLVNSSITKSVKEEYRKNTEQYQILTARVNFFRKFINFYGNLTKQVYGHA